MTEASSINVRPFVAEMPRPIPGESLLGYISRALSNTVCRSLYGALRLGTGKKYQRPRPYNLTIEDADGFASLFKVDPEEFRSRLYPWGSSDHSANSTIEFFGTKIRAQYFEATIRRVSPQALMISPQHKAIWDLRPFSFDPDTRERLLDQCPVCEIRLGWAQMQGPSKCDECTDEQGRPTDLRDYPQPIVEIEDEEAVNFVVGLVHPSPEKRAAAMRLVPDELKSATNSDLFEAVISIASVLLPGNARYISYVGRPKTLDGFAQLTPDRLALAARALIGGESGFEGVADAMRETISQRPGSHGLFKELGPLGTIISNKQLAPAIRSFVKAAIERDFARAHHVGVVRRRSTKIGRQAEVWLNMKELSREFGVPQSAVKRLAESGYLATRRADGVKTAPIQMKRTDVMPLAARYGQAANQRSALSMLRVPLSVMNELAERKIIERIDGATAAMLGREAHFTLASLRAVRIAIDKRTRRGNSSSSGVNLMSAAMLSFSPHVPWATIIDLILVGDVAIRRSGGKSRDWRCNVIVEDLNRFRKVVENAAAAERPGQEEWLSRDQAAQILRASNASMIFAMCAAGLLNPRPEGTLIFRRVEVEAVAKKYVFGAEMLQRMVFNIYHEMYRWLRSRGIEPEFRLKGKYLIYDRKKFEEALSIQPPLLQKLKRKERNYSIEEKRRIIDAVVGGCSISYVSKKMGGRPPEIAKWVEEYQTSGQIRGHAKLDQHQNKLRSIIEGNPVLGPKAILSRLKGEGIQVSAASLYKFMKKLGYFRDSDGNLRRRSVAGRALQCE